MKPGVRVDVSCQAQFVAGYRPVALKILSAQNAEIMAAILRISLQVAYANHGNPSGPYRKS